MSLLDKAKEAAKTVGEKAQVGIKAGQEKIDEAKTKRHVNDLKEEIGGIVYTQRTGTPAADAEAEITRLVAEIKEAEASLAAAETDS
jgi:predicted  nucleic acid-binding Zn-ribbon protein